MKTTCFKNFETGDLDCYTGIEKENVLRVSIEKTRYIQIYVNKKPIEDFNNAPYADEIQLSPSEALYELDVFIENIKQLTGYKNLQRELSEEPEAQVAL